MKKRTRLRYSEADKVLMWDRWQKGDSMNEIARHFAATIQGYSAFCRRTAVFDRHREGAQGWR